MTNTMQDAITGATVETDSWEPRLVAFLCRWCSYAGADLAGGSRFKYPENVRIIRVPCSCRIDPKLVLKSLEYGQMAFWYRGVTLVTATTPVATITHDGAC